jgi:hypothetical protein
MRDDEEKLRFAVRFSEMKLDGPRKKDGTLITPVREGDILNLKDDLMAFVSLYVPQQTKNVIACAQLSSLKDSPGAIFAFPELNLPNALPTDYSIKQLIELQTYCSLILQSAAHGGGIIEMPIDLRFSLLRAPESQCTFLYLTGDFRNIFLYTLFHLINAAERNSILRCPVRGCGKIFYRVRKQRFCSHACAVKASANRRKSKAAKELTANDPVKNEKEISGKRKKFREKPRKRQKHNSLRH